MRYIFATGNAGKVEQIEMIMRLYNIHIKDLYLKIHLNLHSIF